MLKKIMTGFAHASVAATPAGAQTLLDQVLRKVIKPRNVTAVASGPGANAASMSSPQDAALDRLLTTPLQDPAVRASRDEAAPLIRSVLVTAACAKTAKAWNGLNSQHLTPETYNSPGFYDGRAAMTHMKYHDTSVCLDVTRLGDWTKPANNALSFRAWLVAADSGEAKNQEFTLQKATDGQWLIRQVGYIS